MFCCVAAQARVCLPAGSDVYVPSLTKTQSDFKDPAAFFHLSHMLSQHCRVARKTLKVPIFGDLFMVFIYIYLPAHCGLSEKTVSRWRLLESNLGPC